MMTDGMFNGDVSLENSKKRHYTVRLRRYGGARCDKIAERIMSEMERKFRAVADDRTVLVMKVDHVLPDWSSFTPYSQIISWEKTG